MTNTNNNYSPWLNTIFKYRYLVVGVLAFLLYSNTLGHDYTLDDAIVIYDNEFTQKGFSGIPDLLKYDTFRGFFKVEGKDKLVVGGRYRPLTPVMFAIEHHLFGSNPRSHHLISVLMYGLLCVLLLKFLELLFQSKNSMWLFATVLIFTTHPIHTEVVANIKGRDEIMALIFGLLAMVYLLNSKSGPAILFTFLACLSKEMALTWVPISILSLLIIRKHTLANSIKGAWPIITGVGSYLVIRFLVLGFDTSEVVVNEMLNNPFIKLEGGQYIPFSFGEWTSSIAFSLGKYIELLCFPVILTHDYYPRHFEVTNWTNVYSIIASLVYAGLVFLAIYWSKRKPRFSYSIAFYLVSLILISNILFPIGTHLGERFIFMASIGYSMLLALCLNDFISTNFQWVFLISIVGLLSLKTLSRNSTWKNDKTLFLTDVMVSSNSAKCLNAAGGVIVDECLKQQGIGCNMKEIDKAVTYLNKAINIHPNYKMAHLIKGNAHYIKKQYEPAIRSYKNALAIDFSLEDARKNLMLTYIAVAKESGEVKHNPDQAIEYLKEANELDAQNIEILRLLGVAYGVKGDYPQAIKYFEQIITLDEANAAAYLNLGISFNHLGDIIKSEEYLKKAQLLDPTILNN